MQSSARAFMLITAMFAMTAGIVFCAKRKEIKKMLCEVQTADDVRKLFPKSAQEIAMLTDQYIQEAQDDVTKIIQIPGEARTFENTAKALDEIEGLSNAVLHAYISEILEMTSPDAVIRKAAHEALVKIQDFFVDYVSNNRDLYNAFKAYAEGNAKKEKLAADQLYYIKKTMEDFKRNGLNLPEDKLQAVKNLKKELAELELQFGKNISEDNRTVIVAKEGLAGIEEDFLEGLKKTDDGRYILGMDYPTILNVFQNCSVEKTRKEVQEAFENRAYPLNDKILRDVIAKRDQLAHLLGFSSYAALDLDDQMVGSIERAESFIHALMEKAHVKEKQEFDQVVADLPEGVTLSADGKLKPWDGAYVKNYYKKKHFNIDEQMIAEYFPMEKTVKGLLGIYEQFLSLKFKEIGAAGTWHEDVTLIEMHDARTNTLLGYLLLDLYPRANKYSHACHVTTIPSTLKNGCANPAVSVVIANFPKSNAQKPSLLKRSDVSTFFHEFGHAVHALLGRTHLASFSGTHVKRDFVELPSQMLEEWLFDKEILKRVSSHYKTGSPLPDELIDRIIAIKSYSTGGFLQGQLFNSLLALDLFKEGENKNPYEIAKDLYVRYKKNSAFNENGHSYASFGHLTGYGPKYYGYMWSKVFALDVFAEIKKQGLLNPEMGAKYVMHVIGKGGSEDPNELLKNFLGREPNQNAFLRDMGLSA